MENTQCNRSLFGTAAAPLGLSARDPMQLSPLVLAYIGDTVFDLFVRTQAILATDLNAHGLHMQSSKLVCAAAQAQAFFALQSMLTEDELYIFKRGRNSHMGSVPKNASIADYRTATGFEALIGYLYLTEQDERLTSLIKVALTCGKGAATED
ncbi:MAG: ribonuclease III domain-containing protein [Clostridia bacterium]